DGRAAYAGEGPAVAGDAVAGLAPSFDPARGLGLAVDAGTAVAAAVHAAAAGALAGDTGPAGVAGAVDPGELRVGDAEYGVHLLTFADHAGVVPALAVDALIVVAQADDAAPPGAHDAVATGRVLAPDRRLTCGAGRVCECHVPPPFEDHLGGHVTEGRHTLRNVLSGMCQWSSVAAADDDERQQGESGDPGAEHDIVDDGRGRIGGRDPVAQRSRQVVEDVVAYPGRKQAAEQARTESESEHGEHGRERVSQQGAQRDAEQRHCREVATGAEHRPCRSRVAQPDRAVLTGQHRLTQEERGETDRQADTERDEAHRDELGSEQPAALRHRGERGADAAGGVLGGHGEHADHRESDLSEPDSEQADAGCVEGAVGDLHLAGAEPDRDQHGQAHRDGGTDQEQPVRGTQGAQLRPFGSQGVVHDRSASPAYSTLSWVSCMKAASSRARCGVNSCRVRPFWAARSPICAAGIPLTMSTWASCRATSAPDRVSASASAPACGATTRTSAREPEATNSATLVSATSRPRPITTSRSAVSSI